MDINLRIENIKAIYNYENIVEDCNKLKDTLHISFEHALDYFELILPTFGKDNICDELENCIFNTVSDSIKKLKEAAELFGIAAGVYTESFNKTLKYCDEWINNRFHTWYVRRI